MLKKTLVVAITAGFLFIAINAGAHCQVPCGIYDDELRVQLIEEHITTIEKSMRQIVTLGSDEEVNYNQVVRWVNTKEQHAQEIQDIVTAYFFAQRIKAPAGDGTAERTSYLNRLELLHGIQVAAMKAKQGTNPEVIEMLEKLVAKFRVAYFGKTVEHTH